MKKLISLTLILTIALSSLCFAAELPVAPTSSDFSGEIKLGLDMTGPGVDESMQMMLALMQNTNIKYSGTYIQKSDLAIQAYVEMDVVSGMFLLPLKFWMDLDMASKEGITYKIILELPETIRTMLDVNGFPSSQYIMIDYGRFINENPEISDIFNDIISSSLTAENNTPTQSLGFLSDVKAERVNRNHYKITLTDAQIKEMIFSAVNEAMETLFNEAFLSDIIGMFAALENETSLTIEDLKDLNEKYEEMEDIKSELENIYAIIRDVTLLSEDFEYEYKTNNKNIMTHQKTKLHVRIDADEWVKAINAVYPDAADASEEIGIAATFTYDSVVDYKNINTAKRITFPALTKDNSVDFFEVLSGF